MKKRLILKASFIAALVVAFQFFYTNSIKAYPQPAESGGGNFYRIQWIFGCYIPLGGFYDGPGCRILDPKGSCDRIVDCY